MIALQHRGADDNFAMTLQKICATSSHLLVLPALETLLNLSTSPSRFLFYIYKLCLVPYFYILQSNFFKIIANISKIYNINLKRDNRFIHLIFNCAYNSLV